MSKKNTPAKVAAAAIEEMPVIALNVEMESVSDSNPTESDSNPADAPATEVATDVADTKRARNYSQSAINTEDLERLNQLKVFVKEKLKVNVSNQRIITAALNCLGDNVEAFLKGIADEANNKTLAKERKEYEALKAKFDAMEAPKAEATEAPAAA